MARKVRRTEAVTPIEITRNTKEFRGFSVFTDDKDNVTVTAHWLVPRDDGRIDRATKGVDAAPLRALPGFDALIGQ